MSQTNELEEAYQRGYREGSLEVMEMVYRILNIKRGKKTFIPNRQALREHLQNILKEVKSRYLMWRTRYFQVKHDKGELVPVNLSENVQTPIISEIGD